MNKLIIGIDPDVTESGVAVLHPDKKLELMRLSFFNLADYLRHNASDIHIIKVEAGYMNEKSNFHGAKNIYTAARIGKNVGACNEVAKKIVEMCRHYHLPVKEVKPFRKIWRGKDGKITHEELQQQLKFRGIAPIIGRTNQEERDAALICLIG